MRLREWWRELKEQNYRETDERVRTISLLVMRDGFIAVMLLIGALVIVRQIVGGQKMDEAAPDIVAFFPLAAIMVAGSVIGISAALRGGFGWSSGTVAYWGIWHIVGTLLGLGLVAALSVSGVFGPPLGEMWPSMLGVVSGALVGIVIWFLVSRGRNR